MRCFFIFTMVLLTAIQGIAQKNKNKEEDLEKSFTKTEVDANTDTRAWAAYLKKAVVLPDSVAVLIPPGNYPVKLQFVVDKDGNLGDIKAVNNPGYGLALKAEKIIGSYEGIWRPANQCGRNVKSYKEQVLVFVVKE